MCNNIHEEINRFNFKVVVENQSRLSTPPSGFLTESRIYKIARVYHSDHGESRGYDVTRRVEHVSHGSRFLATVYTLVS